MPFAPPDGSAFRYHREKVVFTCPPGHRWLRWAKLARRSQKMFFCRVCKAFLRIWPGKLFSVVAPGANRRGILDAMNREHGYTLMETPGNADTDDDPQRRRPVRLAALAAATTVANCRPGAGFSRSFCAMTPTPTTGTACFASARTKWAGA